MEDKVQKRIADEVAANPVVIYVKGTPEMPMCGFSKAVMGIFQNLGVPFKTVDVLSDPEIRDGVKRFTNWPTIPQVFIKGQFVGGCDIIRDLHTRGELQRMINGPVAK